MTTAPSADYVIDCRNTLCPLPVVRLRQEIDKAAVGKVLRVLATDPASVQDMPAFARNTGHELLYTTRNDGVYEFYFRKEEAEE